MGGYCSCFEPRYREERGAELRGWEKEKGNGEMEMLHSRWGRGG